jgi:hypothetical protein
MWLQNSGVSPRRSSSVSTSDPEAFADEVLEELRSFFETVTSKAVGFPWSEMTMVGTYRVGLTLLVAFRWSENPDKLVVYGFSTSHDPGANLPSSLMADIAIGNLMPLLGRGWVDKVPLREWEGLWLVTDDEASGGAGNEAVASRHPQTGNRPASM